MIITLTPLLWLAVKKHSNLTGRPSGQLYTKLSCSDATCADSLAASSSSKHFSGTTILDGGKICNCRNTATPRSLATKLFETVPHLHNTWKNALGERYEAVLGVIPVHHTPRAPRSCAVHRIHGEAQALSAVDKDINPRCRSHTSAYRPPGGSLEK